MTNLSLVFSARWTANTCRLSQIIIAATAPSMAKVVANLTIGKFAKATWALEELAAKSAEGVAISVLAGGGVSSLGSSTGGGGGGLAFFVELAGGGEGVVALAEFEDDPPEV